MENKKSVILYCDIIHTVDKLEDDEAGRLFKHYLRYVNDLDPESDKLTELLFEPIKQSLKRDLKKWSDKLDKKSDGGKLGNLKRWHLDLYEKVQKQQLTLPMAVEIAKSRTPSDSDKKHRTPSDSIANVADSVSVSVSVSDINKEFDLFWDLYAKKTGKDKCIKKWNKLSEKERSLIFERLPSYIESTLEVKFRKDPLTWLNGKHWEDEIIEQPKKEGAQPDGSFWYSEETKAKYHDQ